MVAFRMSAQKEEKPHTKKTAAPPVARSGETTKAGPADKNFHDNRKHDTPYNKMKKTVQKEILYMHRGGGTSPPVKRDVGGLTLGVLGIPSAASSLCKGADHLARQMQAADNLPRLLQRQQELKLEDSRGQKLNRK